VWTQPAPPSAALLDGGERRRWERLRHDDDRARFATGRALLRRVVGEWWGVAPGSVTVSSHCAQCGARDGRHGQPVVTPPATRAALHVSVAHAAGRVVVAVTDVGPVGVDVEQVPQVALVAVDEVALADPERRALAALPADRRPAARAEAWVRKEAVLKATGDGLTVDPRQVVVTASADMPRLLSWWQGTTIDPGIARLTDLDLGHGYVGCVVLLSDQPARVRLRAAPGVTWDGTDG
jgi:4'-phosphopantetheinyl transferase